MQLRTPPYSHEAESSLIGCLLLDNNTYDLIAGIVSERDFYQFEHKAIFAAISNLINAGKPADVITVAERLSDVPEVDIGLLNGLAQYVPSASNIRRYAELVREKSILRSLIQAGDEIAVAGFEAKKPVKEVLDEAEQKILAIGETTKREGFIGIETLVVDFLDKVQELADSGREVVGTPTGFYDLDRMTSGMHPGDLIVVAGRPAMGKSALAINIAEHVAINERLPVAVFSLEMGAAQLAVRIIGSIGRVDQGHLRTGKLTDDEWPRLAEAVEKLRGVSLHISETGGMTAAELRAAARRLARQTGRLGLVVVDYLQLMSGADKENRATELGEISRGLKLLAKELQCPVIALSQLNRGVESRTEKRPLMSDLRESGAIEQDADVIIFLYRDEYYTKEVCKEPGVAEAIIAKQRSGPTGTVKMTFLNNLTRFESLARVPSLGEKKPTYHDNF